MQFIRQSATHKVVIGPVVAVGDGFTPVTTLSVSTADEAEVILHDNGTVVSISGYTFAAITTADGYYHLTLQSGISGTVGHMTVVINDDSLCLPVRQDFTVLEEAVYDQMFAAAAPGAATVAALATVDGIVDDILVDTAEIGAAGAGLTEAGGTGDQLTAVPWNASWDAEVQSEVNDGLVALGLDHLVGAAVTGTDITDDSIIAQLVSSSATADWDTYDNTSDALQSLRDRGDAAWTTGGGGSITDIVSWHPIIPTAIDLANTKSYRLALALTNMVDDLPTTVEITPGTISIERAGQGGTSWTAIVTDAACSESAGLIYYDEVFDTATTYAAGDVLRVTFKGQLVTVAANDYEIAPSGGLFFYTNIIADTPDVNVATISGSATAADVLELFALALNQGTGQLDSGSFTADSITSTVIQDGAFTSGKFANSFLTAAKIATDAISAAKIATDAITEIQSGLATAASIAALNDLSAADVNAEVVDALDTDTYAELGAVPAATASLSDKITWLAMLARNKITQTATTQTLRNDADSVSVSTATVSDDGTTFTKGEWS